MRFSSLLAFVGCMMLLSQPAFAHTPFKSALQEKYEFRSVSCFACHSKKSEVPEEDHDAYRENAKAFTNDFGKQLTKLLEGKDTTGKLAAVKELDRDDPKKVQTVDEVTADFLEALKQVESQKSPTGPTYGQLLKDGTLDGVRPE